MDVSFSNLARLCQSISLFGAVVQCTCLYTNWVVRYGHKCGVHTFFWDTLQYMYVKHFMTNDLTASGIDRVTDDIFAISMINK